MSLPSVKGESALVVEFQEKVTIIYFLKVCRNFSAVKDSKNVGSKRDKITFEKIEIRQGFKQARVVDDSYLVLTTHNNGMALFNYTNRAIDITYKVSQKSTKRSHGTLNLGHFRFECGITKNMENLLILQNNQLLVFECNWSTHSLYFSTSFSLGKEGSLQNNSISPEFRPIDIQPLITPHFGMVANADGETFHIRFQGSLQIFKIVEGACRLIQHVVPPNFGNSIFDMDGLTERNDCHARGEFIDLPSRNLMYLGYERKNNSIKIFEKRKSKSGQ